MLPDHGFVSDVEVVVILVGSDHIISGTACDVLSWRCDLCGNSQEGGKQRQ